MGTGIMGIETGTFIFGYISLVVSSYLETLCED